MGRSYYGAEDGYELRLADGRSNGSVNGRVDNQMHNTQYRSPYGHQLGLADSRGKQDPDAANKGSSSRHRTILRHLAAVRLLRSPREQDQTGQEILSNVVDRSLREAAAQPVDSTAIVALIDRLLSMASEEGQSTA